MARDKKIRGEKMGRKRINGGGGIRNNGNIGVGRRNHPHDEFWERGQRAQRQISLWLCSGLFAICWLLTHKTHTHAPTQPFIVGRKPSTCWNILHVSGDERLKAVDSE